MEDDITDKYQHPTPAEATINDGDERAGGVDECADDDDGDDGGDDKTLYVVTRW